MVRCGPLELLPWLARRVRGCGVFVLATMRSDELAGRSDLLATVAELERQRLGERIALAPLEPDAVEAMVRAIAVDVSPALVDAVRRRSDGNPLFVEELVRTLGGGSDEVPPSIDEAFVRRIARLPADAQGLLSVASVAGERFDLEPVRRIAGLDQAPALAAMRAALELQLVSEERRGGFRFRHALTRDAVYSRLLVLERRELHGRVAAALAADGDVRAAEAAFHYEAAGDAERARESAERAAARAMELGALADARVHVRTALRVSRGARDRARLLARRPVGGRAGAARGTLDLTGDRRPPAPGSRRLRGSGGGVGTAWPPVRPGAGAAAGRRRRPARAGARDLRAARRRPRTRAHAGTVAQGRRPSRARPAAIDPPRTGRAHGA